MEYVNDRGEYADLPYEEMMGVFREHYPRMMAALAHELPAADWDRDVRQETGAG
jgi:hypothetical protein